MKLKRFALLAGSASACMVGALMATSGASASIVFLNDTSLPSVFDTHTVGEADDGFAFIDKASLASDPPGSSFSASFQPINRVHDFNFVTNGPVTIGNGQADVKASDTTFTTLTVTPNLDSFDGFFIRGLVDRSTKCSAGTPCAVDMTVNFVGGGSESHIFTNDDVGGDFHAIGFDETPGTLGVLVSSVVISTATGENFDEIKQMGFSVPGGTPTIPEPSTWAMLLLGFAGLGYVGFRRSKKDSVAALA